MLPYRELYCPAHFGNSYEVMWPREMRAILAEGREWGYNVYGDWFDFADLKSPWDNPLNEWLMPQALWERKLAHFRNAAELGYRIDLVITANQVFLSQMSDDLRADLSDKRFFGQLLCPSKPQARALMLDNARRMFEDLAAQGIPLSSLSGFAFDYGGCNCADCRPWIVTFGKLFAEVLDLGQRYFPGIAGRLVGWWWTQEEHAWFKEWADAAQPGRFLSLAAHIPYGDLAPGEQLPLPQGCEPHAFVHIGYADQAEPRDVYGPWGPVIAPQRIPATVATLEAQGYQGFMAYSEGIFDDVNKALLGGLASGAFADAEAVLAAYAERYLGARGGARQDWAAWLSQWGAPFAVDVPAARRAFEQLSAGAPDTWRLRQWAGKLDILEAHQEVSRGSAWDAERLAAAERFFAARERLQRGVWGLGLVRHGLNERYHQPAWYKDWQAQQQGRNAGAKMSSEA